MSDIKCAIGRSNNSIVGEHVLNSILAPFFDVTIDDGSSFVFEEYTNFPPLFKSWHEK